MGYETEEWHEKCQELRKQLVQSETKYEELLEKYNELYDEHGELEINADLMIKELYPKIDLVPTAWDRLYEHVQQEDLERLNSIDFQVVKWFYEGENIKTGWEVVKNGS